MLTTLDTVKEELDITSTDYDGRLTRYIKEASAQVESFCGRSFEYQEGIVESIPARGGRNIVLSRRPVTNLISITFAGQTVDPDEYKLDSETGLVFRAYGWPWDATLRTKVVGDKVAGTESSELEATYDGGYVTPQQVADDDSLTRTLPYDLEGWVIALVSLRETSRGVNPSIVSEKLGDASVSYGRGTGSAVDDIWNNLMSYREVF